MYQIHTAARRLDRDTEGKSYKPVLGGYTLASSSSDSDQDTDSHRNPARPVYQGSLVLRYSASTMANINLDEIRTNKVLYLRALSSRVAMLLNFVITIIESSLPHNPFQQQISSTITTHGQWQT